MTKHTPTPWKAIEHENKNAFEGNIVITKNDMNDAVCTIWTCDTEEETQANAEFIVRAVNSHETLVNSLEQIVLLDDKGSLFNRQSDFDTWQSEELENAIKSARDAIAKAKVE